MNQSPNIFVFSIIMALFFIAIDVYVLSRWSSFTKRNAMNPWWRRLPWVFSVLSMAAMTWVAYRRHIFRVDGMDAVLLGLSSLWFLPKIGIVIVLIVRDTIRMVSKLIGWKGARNATRHENDHASDETDAPQQPEADRSRRAFLTRSAWSLSAIPYVVVGNGLFRTLYDFQVQPVELVLPSLPRAMDGIKLVQISDIHAGSFVDDWPMQEARRLIEQQQPDVIVITGDFVNSKPEELALIARELSKLRAPEGVLASLGNHDHYHSAAEHKRLTKSIRELGIDLLVNDHRRIGNGDASFVIAGTDNIGFRQDYGDVSAALAGVEDGEPVILLAHDPTLWDKQIVGQQTVDLMLSGHTHGGQFGIQALGFEWSPAQYVYQQWAGLYRKGEQTLYVNRGLGTVGPPIRIGIRPEITVFTLRAPSITDSLVQA